MALIITNQDCTLSQADAFYECVASNVSAMPASFVHHILTTRRNISVVPSASGNFKGCVVGFYLNCGFNTAVNINAQFQRSYSGTTVTMATPGVFTTTGMDFTEGQKIMFTTTGALYTGLVVGTEYFVRNPNVPAGTYNVSLTVSGALVNTSGSQSGVHTAHATLAEQTLTPAEIMGYTPSGIYESTGSFIINCNNFSASPAITAGGTYRLTFYSTNFWYLCVGYDGTYPFYIVYTDTLKSFSDNDTPVFAHYCEIDQSSTFGSLLGTNDTIYGSCGFICSNTNVANFAPSDISFLRCTAPVSAYTLTLTGGLYLAYHSGIQIGTLATPIPTTTQFVLNHSAPVIGTSGSGLRGFGSSSSQNMLGYNSTVLMYSESPIVTKPMFTADILAGSTTIVLDTDMSSTWSIGDTIQLTKQYTKGVGEFVDYTIKEFGIKEIVPKMTAANIPSPFVISASSTNSSLYPWEAFDKNLGQDAGWASIGVAGQWHKTDLGGLKTVIRYMMNCENIVRRLAAPKDWILEGSVDNSTWTLVDTRTNITDWSTYNYYTVNSPGSYRYYRITISTNNGEIYGYINELQYYEAATDNKTFVISKMVNTYNRMTGGYCINTMQKYYGIAMRGAATSIWWIPGIGNFNLEGIYINTMYSLTSTYGATAPYFKERPEYSQVQTFNDCLVLNVTILFQAFKVSPKGFTIDNIITINARGFAFDIATMYGYRAGDFTFSNNTICHTPSNSVVFTWVYKSNCKMINNKFINTGVQPCIFWGAYKGSYIDGLEIYGSGITPSSYVYGAIQFYAFTQETYLKNINFNYSGVCFCFRSNAPVLSTLFENINCSNSSYSYLTDSGCFFNVVLKNCIGFNTASFYACDSLYDTLPGTTLKFRNYDTTTNDDRVYSTYGDFQRCGTGLTDTTVHTSGTSAYSLRMQPVGTDNLEWTFKVPTGPISGKTMVIAVWVKISTSAFYANTHTKPTLAITYDETTITTATAISSTDWQLITVPFTPTTDYSEVTFNLYGASDATLAADRQFYVDDISVLYPAGVILNLGAMDLWANALPIGPPIATSINASDVWSVLTSTLTNAGSIGELITSSLNNVDGKTFNEIMLILSAVIAGKVDITNLGGSQAIINFRNLIDTKNRVTTTMNGSERTNVSFDLS